MYVNNCHPLLHSHSHVSMANVCVLCERGRCDLLLCRGIISIQGPAEPTRLYIYVYMYMYEVLYILAGYPLRGNHQCV